MMAISARLMPMGYTSRSNSSSGSVPDLFENFATYPMLQLDPTLVSTIIFTVSWLSCGAT